MKEKRSVQSKVLLSQAKSFNRFAFKVKSSVAPFSKQRPSVEIRTSSLTIADGNLTSFGNNCYSGRLMERMQRWMNGEMTVIEYALKRGNACVKSG